MSKKISELAENIPDGERISAGMLDMLQEGVSLRQMVEHAYRMLENPVMLVDVTLNYEASAGADEIDDEPVWEYTIKNGFMPNYYLNHIAGSDNPDAAETVVTEEPAGTILNHRQIAVKCIQAGRLTGHFMVLQRNRDISAADIKLIQIISVFMAILMSRRLGSDEFRFSVIENFLTSIIRNKITSPEEIETRQELFSIKLYDVLHVITIELTDFRAGDDKKLNLLRRIRKLFDRNNVIRLNDYIVVLYDIKSANEAFSQEMMDEFTEILERYNCEANISYPFRSLRDFYAYYVQTVYCMEMRARMNLHMPVLRYSDVIQYHMLLSFSEQVDLDLMLNGAVAELMRADEDNDSDYTNTLFIYVNCQQNMSKAAEQMQLHYNTLKYRINRITAMTGIDLNDENTVFSVMISERILHIKEMMAHSGSSIQGLVDNEWHRRIAAAGMPDLSFAPHGGA